MRLTELNATVVPTAHRLGSPADPELIGVCHNAQRVEPGMLFVAIRGSRADGNRFAADAVARGAVAVLGSDPSCLASLPVPVLLHPDPRTVLGPVAAAIHAHPSRSVEVVAVTGTNGKTSTVHILASILRAAGRSVGLVGTLGARAWGPDGVERSFPTELTTPEASDLQSLLSRMRDAGCSVVALEASSWGLATGRLDATEVAVACFTNLSRDHLDVHGSMEAYGRAKAGLFLRLLSRSAGRETGRPRGAVLNLDDPFVAALAAEVEAAGIPALGVRLRGGEGCGAFIEEPRTGADGVSGTLKIDGTHIPFACPLLGSHNLDNLLVAAAAAHILGVLPDAIASGLAATEMIPGRMERVGDGRTPLVLVDYAHTPEALARVLREVRAFGSGRVIAVFGCGGDRDEGKRPEMGAAAAREADVLVLTSDNPRGEDPDRILQQITEGVRAEGVEPALVEAHRALAIQRAIALADPSDSVVIAGKGHEEFQILGDRRLPFSDREVAAQALRAGGGR